MADTQHTRTSGQAQADTTYASNTSGDIGAADWRQEQRDIYESAAILSSANTFTQTNTFAAITATTGAFSGTVNLTSTVPRVSLTETDASNQEWSMVGVNGGLQFRYNSLASTAVILNNSGNATFLGDVATGALTVNSAGVNTVATFESTDAFAQIFLKDNSTTNGEILRRGGNVTSLYDGGGALIMNTDGSGNATFSGTATFSGDVIMEGKTSIGDGNILTIASGAVTATTGYHIIAAQTGTADSLQTINGGITGQVLVLKADSGDTIAVSGGGNIDISTSGLFNMTGGGTFMCIYDGSNWLEISRSTN